MSAPPNDGYGQQNDQHGQQLPYDDQAGLAAGQDTAQAKKKKRGYAAQAFEVGTGANAGVGGQMQGGGQQYGMPPTQSSPSYGAYPQPEPQPVPGTTAAPGYQYPQGNYGAPQASAPQPAYGGYQAPDQSYPAAGAQPPIQGVAGITQGMAGMQMGVQPQLQPAQQAGPAARPAILNQLYPTDLLSQPFNVSELELPPPPIVLPPNVRQSCHCVPKFVILAHANLMLIDKRDSVP